MPPACPELSRFLADDSGLETAEYAVIAAMIVAGLLAAVLAIGTWVKRRLHAVKTGVGA
jgi:Flp pilus assembly pilin Flp